MDFLTEVTQAQQVQPFLFPDSNSKPTKCNLLVSPAQKWAIATELPAGGTGLIHCHISLAAAICKEYDIEPEALMLFIRYTYAEQHSDMYVVRFGHGSRDFFEGVHFVAPQREQLTEDEAAQLVQEVSNGRAPASHWRALAQPHR
jgi:hypothetical protein